MKEIHLTQGKVALVDDADYDYLMQWKWFAWKTRHTWYAGRTITGGRGLGRVQMHTEILLRMGLSGMADHRDRDGLNNQRENLRQATRQQQCFNRKRFRNNRSGFKGVTKSWNRWRARIRINGQLISVGFFASREEAARAYDQAAVRLHGDFASLNFEENRRLYRATMEHNRAQETVH